MEKLLAMSILSFLSDDPSGDKNARIGGRSSTAQKKAAEEEDTRTAVRAAQELKAQPKQQHSLRFAPEIDGLHCFETLVSY